jgi:RHS repeat-associated protein
VGNLTNIVYSRNHAINLAYDALSRPTNMVDAVGATAYSYDGVGQVLSENGPWTDDAVSYTYTNRLRTRTSVMAPDGAPWTQSYAYDAARRLTNTTSVAGAFAYTYGATQNLNVARLGLPGGAFITNTYDSVARLLSTTLKNPQSSTFNAHLYAYSLAGQRTWETNTMGDYRAYTYDPMGQLVGAGGHESSGAARLQEQLGYVYDAAGNLNYRTNNALLGTFSVNSLNELTTVGASGTLTVAGTTTSPATNVTVWGSTGLASGLATLYADSTWARTNATLPNGSVTYTATAQDRYLRQSTNSVTVNLPASASYTYDLNGNLLSDGTRTFAYDDENQLITVYVTNVLAGATNVSRSDFVYDGRMRRRERFESALNGGTWLTNTGVFYVYDGNLVVQERNGGNLPVVTYTRGRDLGGTFQGAGLPGQSAAAAGGIGGLLARTDNSVLATLPSAAHAYYHADGNGNITCLINSSNAVMARYLYDPFGRILSQSGSLAAANLYRFSSKEFHVSSGTYYYLYRFYDPSLQRWVNRDPLGEKGFEQLRRVRNLAGDHQANAYSFVLNNPCDVVDPNGDWLWPVVAIILIIVIIWQDMQPHQHPPARPVYPPRRPPAHPDPISCNGHPAGTPGSDDGPPGTTDPNHPLNPNNPDRPGNGPQEPMQGDGDWSRDPDWWRTGSGEGEVEAP